MRREIDDILGGSMDAKEFHQLKNLAKKITDYDAQDDDDDEEVAGAKDEEEIDDRQGAAVDSRTMMTTERVSEAPFINRWLAIGSNILCASEDEVDGEDESDQPVPEAGIGVGPESTDAAADTLDGEAMIINSAPQGKSAQDKPKDTNYMPVSGLSDAPSRQRSMATLGQTGSPPQDLNDVIKKEE
ncbi:hypothetical protein MAPG_03460 [Magnaporthiopsis poae ATCC 64411]|uniref:Uncharacterized protein n=1 Tax=Magnaporthiopsis poae (strain ATCC 64411 / 73-15) TaxID=644358 RepID=A0A0C4DU26_MAGP6|nr:hypothetical protein MAPG_03460 [Magnaporthiopsis poae ATCC 64411]